MHEQKHTHTHTQNKTEKRVLIFFLNQKQNKRNFFKSMQGTNPKQKNTK